MAQITGHIQYRFTVISVQVFSHMIRLANLVTISRSDESMHENL